jgi:hypothetical protein
MRLKLETVLSTLGVLTAVAYVLGWLQAFYYFDTFGVRLAAVEMTPQDYLLNSWFVVENIVFFLILIWAILSVPRWWTVLLGVAYFFIPIGSHYAFFYPHVWGANFLIEYRHTLLKFIPFGLLLVVALLNGVGSLRRTSNMSLSGPQARLGFVLLVVVVGAWSISVAKHFGSYDANLELRYPDRMLSRIRLHLVIDASEAGELTQSEELYLVHATPGQLFVWDARGFRYGGLNQKVDVHVIARDKVQWFETLRRFQVQRGTFIF